MNLTEANEGAKVMGMGEAEDITGATRERNYGTLDAAEAWGMAVVRSETQAFFAELRESVRPGYVGDSHRAFVLDLLKRAQSAGLYTEAT